MNRLACALVLAVATLAGIACPGFARAAPQRAQTGMTLSILTPDPGSIVDRAAVDVSFRGGSVDTVELYLDGALIAKRQISTAQSRGVISFSIETLQLTEGSHDLQVKTFGPDGKSATSTAKLRIPGLDLNAPVRISYPQNGIQVNGIVPIRVFMDQDIQRQRPYVTFFVDKELKVLKNYPPYEYAWDTTKVMNGWHIVEAWTQSPEAVSPTKARPVHVNVNNSGGETKKQDKIEDLRTAAKTPETTAQNPAKAQIVRPDAVAASKGNSPDVTGKTPLDFRISSAKPKDEQSLRSNDPRIYKLAQNSNPAVVQPDVTPNNARVDSRVTAPKLMGGAVSAPKGRMAIASRSKNTLPGLGNPDGLYAIVSPQRDSDLLKVEPGETLGAISRKTGVSAKELARMNNLKHDGPIPAGHSIIVPRSGAFDVAFDGIRIAFDVQPRIESGIKLAPFRQIFEHTGGRLYWFNEVKTVKAVNSARDIEIKIGNSNALVNNSTVSMERKPYIISGRTIVPLTFIRDALSVKINFDDKSGRLMIETGK